MRLKQSVAAGGLVLAFLAPGNAQVINPSKIVDLTYRFDASTIYWPGEHPFEHQYEKYGKTPDGYFYSSARYAAPEHGGTHLDAPIHFNQNGLPADRVPLSDCVGPAAVIDFSTRAAEDRDATLGLADLKKYEAAFGRIPDGAIVIARSGWGKFWPDRKNYLGSDRADASDLHFPGFSPEVIRFLLGNRKPAAIAIDTASIDAGQAKEFPVHVLWLGSNHPAFENLANAEALPPKGATVFCIPMKIGGGTGGPTRIFAVVP
ncbi:MAG TPA: cyclase family protein [Candidatus Binataceae bacterium]